MKRRRVRADISSDSISSHGGAWLLREVGRRLGLTARVAGRLDDGRQQVEALAPGYEDRTDDLLLTLVPSILAALRRA